MRLIDADKIPYVKSENGCLEDFSFRYDINEVETADAHPVVHAKWIYGQSNAGFNSTTLEFHIFSTICSECKFQVTNKSNYCPNCGAKMDGE